MTDIEKKVVVRLCAKIPSETSLYDTGGRVRNLIGWICVSRQIESDNNRIRNLTGEYKRIEPDCRNGVQAQLERMRSLCKERDSLYKKQSDLRGQKQEIEFELERWKYGVWRRNMSYVVVTRSPILQQNQGTEIET